MTEGSFTRVFLLALAGLAALFTALQPAPTAGLAVPVSLLFWLAHIGVGLALAVVAARWVGAWGPLRLRPMWIRLLCAGIIGAAVFAPFSSLMEAWFPEPIELDPLDDPLDRWDAAGGWRAIAAEFAQMAPAYLTAWMLINTAPLLDERRLARAFASASHGFGVAEVPASALDSAGRAAPASLLQPDAIPAAPAAPPVAQQAWLQSLPARIGSDVISVSSELHYLHVTTTRGRAMVLGNLGEVEAQSASWGMRVHRSHWVAHAHLRRITKAAGGSHCELSDGRSLPISRRRLADVRRRAALHEQTTQ